MTIKTFGNKHVFVDNSHFKTAKSIAFVQKKKKKKKKKKWNLVLF